MVITGACESSSDFMPMSSAGCHALAAGHAEGADAAVLERLGSNPLEELGVLGIGKRIAAFDEVEAELVEAAGDE